LQPVEQYLGFSLRPLPHENASVRPADSRPAYDAAARDLVAEVFAEDIARFGYGF